MYDWNKDGKIDMVDHWITYKIINYEKERRENGNHYTSYKPIEYSSDNSNPQKESEKGPSLMTIILIDIALFALLCLMNGA